MTDFKPGDKVRVVLDRVVNEDGGIHVLGRNEPLAGLMGWPDVDVTRCDTPAPAPYTEPRDGDKAEVWFVGDVKRVGDGLGFFAEGLFLNTGNLAKAVAEGRVRLVKAAAPQFERGRFYRSESTGRTFLYAPSGCAGATAFWFEPAAIGGSGWFEEHEIPSDLRPCDVVPREAT